MRKILPILLILIGVGGGIGAGLALRPEPSSETAAEHCPEPAQPVVAEEEIEAETDFVKLNSQFVVPIVTDDLVDSMVVMSLSIEGQAGMSEAIFAREPKLRDAFLQVLFDHANVGGFRGNFTNSSNLDVLRLSLKEAAQSILGEGATGVLITDIARQDM